MSEDYQPGAPPPPAPLPAPTAPGGGPRLPWEERQQHGLVDALVATIKMLVTAPAEAFRRLRADGDLVSPILFAVIVGTVGQLFGQFWSLLFGSAMSSFSDAPWAAAGGGLLQTVLIVAITPIVIPIFLFIGAGIYHLCLMLVGAVEQSPMGFEGTLKVVAYSMLANLAGIVPIAGGFIALIGSLILTVIGLSTVHQTTQGKAIVAVLIPLVLCCVCVLIGIFVFGVSMAGLAGAAASGAG